MRNQRIETNNSWLLPHHLASSTSSTPCATNLRNSKQYEEYVRAHDCVMQTRKGTRSVSRVEEDLEVLTHTRKREIRVEKPEDEDFGAALLCFDDAIFVAYVEKYASDDTYTAAYRAGLKFGDEICSINRVNVSDLCRSVPNGLLAAKCELTCAHILILEVIDQSAFSQHTIALVGQGSQRVRKSSKRGFNMPEQMGVLFADDGDILDVAEGSVGEKSGLRRGLRLVRIGGQFLVNKSPRSYEKLFKKLQRKNQEVTVTVGNSLLTCGLIAEASRYLTEMHTNYDLLSYNLNVHLENDFNFEPKTSSSMSRFRLSLRNCFRRGSKHEVQQ